jgi:hypothetical protein
MTARCRQGRIRSAAGVGNARQPLASVPFWPCSFVTPVAGVFLILRSYAVEITVPLARHDVVRAVYQPRS